VNGKIFYTIYKITNIISGKIYIGAHKTKKLYDNYYGSNKELASDIKKYGKDNFTREYLFFFDSVDEMYEKEEEIVNVEFLLSENTYNIRLGGMRYGRHSESSKEKMRKSHEGMKKPWVAETNKSRSGESHPLYGKKRPEETIEKMRESHKGQIAWNKGKKMSEDFCKKNSEGQLNRPKYDCEICGKIISGKGNLKQHTVKCKIINGISDD
jgi:group I intron endonuclease